MTAPVPAPSAAAFRSVHASPTSDHLHVVASNNRQAQDQATGAALGHTLGNIPPAPGNQTALAIGRLRAMLLGGEIRPETRLTEQSLVDRLGVSRTPVRAALQRLELEGLLEALPGGGFKPRRYSRADIWDAIEMHAAVESLAVRRAAERGVPPSLMAQARETLVRIDAVLSTVELGIEGYQQFMARNEEFHGLLAAMSGSSMIERQLDRSAHHPLVAPINCVLVPERLPLVHQDLIRAQEQHRHILDAIKRHESTRAESLTQEHARLYARNLMGAIQMRGIPLIHGL